MQKINLFWFRRDLRIEDNHGFYEALKSNLHVLPIFIFDVDILNQLENKKDARVNFIFIEIQELKASFEKLGSSLLLKIGKPKEIFSQLLIEFDIKAVFANDDYEPSTILRDKEVAQVLKSKGISLQLFKNDVIFEKSEVTKKDGKPYTIFTPYMRQWKLQFVDNKIKTFSSEKLLNYLLPIESLPNLSLGEIGFLPTEIEIPSKAINNQIINQYTESRDFPAKQGTSRLGLHLRFGTISIRNLVAVASEMNETYLNELIWREFYKMILWHFPLVVNRAFKPQYDTIQWRNNEVEFEAWCAGKTGYPLVDAGMRELNATGFMHNRVRMVVASFLVKHLLIDWRWGETYFANKLLDYELSANNGGWQWAAGCGCDAAPYFRVFNPELQAQKFDAKYEYIRKWIPEWGTIAYPQPIVNHAFARERILSEFKRALEKNNSLF